MDKSKKPSTWLEQGYSLFAEEGPDGLQVERLARILQLNKSGFYHYFGDMEGYISELVEYHKREAELYFTELRHIRTIDPEFFQIVVRFKAAVMFQMQLLRCGKNSAHYQVAELLDSKEDELLREPWSEYLGYRENPELALRYYAMVRDMFYARASIKNLTYEFLRGLISEARMIVHQIAESQMAIKV